MTCPNCQTVNPEGAKFCFNCGHAMPQACANCGTPLATDAKFCSNCGHKAGEPVTEAPVASTAAQVPAAPERPQPQQVAVETNAVSPDAPLQKYMPGDLLGKLQEARTSRTMSGERRIVTILFCDVKGSTSMAESMDPEEWADIMNQAFDYLISPVYKYEGTLARLMGDAILAFFGAPIAHEDDPQRAILAGLEIVDGIKPFREQMKREHELDFNVRVGINTGLVVVGDVGSDMRVEYTAMGDVVNVASRMEQTAEAGTVQVAANTYKTVSNLFDFKPLGEVDLRGKTEPILAYQVLRRREGALPTRGIEGLYSPMVGRDLDLRALEAKVQELKEGRGQIVSVMGEAGLGKSRLVSELRKWVFDPNASASPGQNGHADNQPGVRWYEGRSLSYDSNTPYAPFISLLQQVFDLKPGDTSEQAYNAIRTFVQEVAPDAVDRIAPFLGTLLGTTLTPDDLEKVKYLEPPQLRAQVFAATQALVESLVSKGSAVFVFEDLHWADPTSLELLDRLMPIADEKPLMLLAIFRPQHQELYWGFHEAAQRDYSHRYTSISLEPLDEQSSRTLVSNLLEIEDLPEDVRLLILKKSEGNPFFVEEVIRSLLDNGLVVREGSHWRATREIENIQVPDTLAGVITARLDRLDKESKTVAQTASVIGREFGFKILDAVCDEPQTLEPAITDLEIRELVREKNLRPSRAYLFKHVLTQETAYASILLSKRRELHLRVAERLAQMEPDRVYDIGRHFIEARESGRALPYLVEAGDRAAKAYASREALSYYADALDALEKADDPQMARRAYEGKGGVLLMSGDIAGAIDTYQQMLGYAETHNDSGMKVSAFNKLARAAMFTGQMDELEKNLTASEDLARENEDLGGLVEMFTVRCAVCNMVGDFETANRYMSESVEASRSLNLGPQRAWSMTHTALSLTYMTRFDEAKVEADKAVDFAESIGDLAHLSEALSMPMSLCYIAAGDLDNAEAAARRAFDIATEANIVFTEATSTMMLSTINYMLGKYEKAMEYAHRAIKAAQASGYGFIALYPLSTLGTMYLEISPKLADKTREYHSAALQVLHGPAGTYGLAWADVQLGYSALALGETDKAREYFETGVTVPSPEWLLLRPSLLAGQALVLLAEHKTDEAATKLEEARSYDEEHGMKDSRPRIDVAQARIALANGDRDGALECFRNAEKYAGEMGMKPMAWQAQSGQAEILALLGREEEAEQKRSDARKIIDEIAGLFKDEELKSLFLENALNKVRTGEEFLI